MKKNFNERTEWHSETATVKRIHLHLDGVIVDLQGVHDWEKDLQLGCTGPYIAAKPLCNMKELADVITKLVAFGWEIRITSMVTFNCSDNYKERIAPIRTSWLQRHHFPIDKCIIRNSIEPREIWESYIKNPFFSINKNSPIDKPWKCFVGHDPKKCNFVEELKKLLKEETMTTIRSINEVSSVVKSQFNLADIQNVEITTKDGGETIIITRAKTSRQKRDEWTDAILPTISKRIRFLRDGNVLVGYERVNGVQKSAIAVCDPWDEFDERLGKCIVFFRLNGRKIPEYVFED